MTIISALHTRPVATADTTAPAEGRSVTETARALATAFARRAGTADEDAFVAENFARLKETGLVAAAVPAALGGGDAGIDELAGMLRILAQGCGSTALAFAMHTHQVAIPAWRWRAQPAEAVEKLLKRLAQERIVLLSSGGSDWIGGSGRAEKVAGGWRITARKVFASGAPAGDLLMTSALVDGAEGGEVLHFAVPMSAPEVKVLDTWRTLGMRGTGSHDIVIDGYVVPEAAVAARRKAGEWHPLFQIIATLAFPLVYAVYLGVAESARDSALALARRREPGRATLALAGRLETELAAARLAHAHMLAAAREAPSAETVNRVMTGKALVTRHALAVGELALELAGGAGFHRAAGLERKFRDLQAARFHPLREAAQAEYAGAMALGLPVDRIW